jgi:hypothetical protein
MFVKHTVAEGSDCGLDACLAKLRKTAVSFFDDNMLFIQSVLLVRVMYYTLNQ